MLGLAETDAEELTSLSEKMYDGYGLADEVGISYFKKFARELAQFEFSAIAGYQMANYPHRYALDFLLATPFLWADLSPAIWTQLLARSGARPDVSRMIDQVGNFADIEFLSRYVKVDAIGFLIVSPDIAKLDKQRMLDYFLKNAYALVPSDLDDEDLDGLYFVDREILARLRVELCIRFGFKHTEYTEDNVREKLRLLQERL